MINNEELMHYCNDIALNGVGFVSPNPLVGAVIVDADGNILAEGWHREIGGLHAEVEAIKDAKHKGITDFSNTTMVVNLEPCDHIGKQPPCAEAILEARIPNVVIGMKDPNPIVSGRGIKKLEDNGVNVTVGVAESDCRWINRYYCQYVIAGMPYCILKIAQSADGCIATKSGESKYITGDESRRRVHFLRLEVDAILVGINTIIADDPILDTRMIDDDGKIRRRNPKIIILDSNLRTPITANVLSQHTDRLVLIVHSDEILKNNSDILAIKKRMEDLKAAGAILIESPMKSDKIHLRKIISRLTLEYCFTSLLVEGGAEVFSSFINSNIINEIHTFTAPSIIGDGIHPFSKMESKKMDDIRKFRIAGSFPSGEDQHTILINKKFLA